jgi:hypothetical protein
LLDLLGVQPPPTQPQTRTRVSVAQSATTALLPFSCFFDKTC